MAASVIDAIGGAVSYKPLLRRVAIIGAGATRVVAPWEDSDVIFYALNEIWQKRYDAHFELHPRAVQSERDLEFLRSCPTPCYVLDLAEWDGMIPHAVQYPLERVLDITRGRRYFTSTFSFQIALAIAEGFTEIGLWGVDLARGTLRERLVEAPCVEYWVGLAEGRGIKVTVPEISTLCSQPYLYGYDYDAEVGAVNKQCDEAVMALPRKRWPAVLQRLGAYYGGAEEARMIRAAAELARTAPLSCADWADLDRIATRLDDRVEETKRAFGIEGAWSA